MRRRWHIWKRRQLSRTRYVLVPAGTWIAPCGLMVGVSVVELRQEAL